MIKKFAIAGYTIEQREDYQTMRRELVAHRKDILIVKDFSRFSRRNSRELVELEDLRDALVLELLFGTGVPVSELRALTPETFQLGHEGVFL